MLVVRVVGVLCCAVLCCAAFNCYRYYTFVNIVLVSFFPLIVVLSCSLVMQNWEDGSQGGLNCTAVNKETKKVVQFELEMDDDVEEGEEAEWDYTPGAHADLLPEYLREEISFPLSAAPKFVTRLVDALCEDTKK